MAFIYYVTQVQFEFGAIDERIGLRNHLPATPLAQRFELDREHRMLCSSTLKA